MLKVNIEFETADSITKENLKKIYEQVCSDITKLNSRKKNLKPHEKEDLKDFTEHKESLSKVLKYFMTFEEAEEFFTNKEKNAPTS
jgi:predicted kinase